MRDLLRAMLMVGIGAAATFALFLPGLICISATVASWLSSSPMPKWVIFLIAGFLTFALHEAGHVVGFRVSGGRVYGVGFGPILLRRTSHGWQFSRNQHHIGFVVGAPSPTAPVRSYVTGVAAGPIANLLPIPVLLAMGFAPPDLSATFGYLTLILAISSFSVGIMSLVPVVRQGLQSDGARLVEIALCDDALRRGVAALVRIQALDFGGVPPAEWPDDDVQTAARLVGTGSPNAWLTSLCVTFPGRLAQRAYPEAHAEAEALLEHLGELPQSFARVVHVQAAYVAAQVGQTERAHALLASAPQSGLQPVLALACAEAALLMAEGNEDRARGLAHEALKGSVPHFGQERLWRELLEEMA